MVTEPLHIATHQQLQELEDEVGMNMHLAFFRLTWMAEDGAFEAKAFVLRQLKALHAVLCAQHFHAPTKPSSGDMGAACAYCLHGHDVATTSADSAEPKYKFGVNV